MVFLGNCVSGLVMEIQTRTALILPSLHFDECKNNFSEQNFVFELKNILALFGTDLFIEKQLSREKIDKRKSELKSFFLLNASNKKELVIFAISASSNFLIDFLTEEINWLSDLLDGYDDFCVSFFLIGSFPHKELELSNKKINFIFLYGGDDKITFQDSEDVDSGRALNDDEIVYPSVYASQQASLIKNHGETSRFVIVPDSDHFLFCEGNVQRPIYEIVQVLNSKYSDIAVSTFNKSSSHFLNSPLHKTTKLANRLRDMFSGPIEIMDIGCGPGHWGKSLFRSGDRLIFIDPSSSMLNKIKEDLDRSMELSVMLICGDLESDKHEKLPKQDLITSRLALHHFPSPFNAILKMKDLLKDEGCVAILDLQAPVDSSLRKIHDMVEILHDGSHVRTFTHEELNSFFVQNGFVVEDSISDHKESDVGIPIQDWFCFVDTPELNRSKILKVLSDLNSEDLQSIGFSHSVQHGFRYHALSHFIIARKSKCQF